MTSAHLSPAFKGPRKSGDRFTPDAAASPSSTRIRGAYPKDRGGPPETRVGSSGPSGDPFTPATPSNDQVDRVGPRKTVKANTLTNPLK